MHVCGARPNFMKVAPLIDACREHGGIESILVHTGQHYDRNMSELFFDELGLPQPDVDLGVGSGTHAEQTAEIMRRFEPVLHEHRPDWVIVVGDVNSTIACSLVAVKLGVRVAHVEAGLRSFDRSMPEEINRVLTDAIAHLLFVTERVAIANLEREGIPSGRIHFAGNVMIDTLRRHEERARRSPALERLGLRSGGFALVTLHRPSNVDDQQTLQGILSALCEIGRDLPVLFPAHPRTRERMSALGLPGAEAERLRVVDPLGYLDFVRLMAAARGVLTDSGGVQEETTILGVPCLTLRRNTERPVTIEQGTNRLVAPERDAIVRAWRTLGPRVETPPIPERWDGHAARRIVDVLVASGRPA